MLAKITFPKGSEQDAVTTPGGYLHIKGYPSVVLGDEDWEAVFTGEELIRDNAV